MWGEAVCTRVLCWSTVVVKVAKTNVHVRLLPLQHRALMVGGGDVPSLMPQSLFYQMLKYKNNSARQQRGFYTYNAFVAVAK
ncbi:hypothetical protein AMTR_s00079p00183380 [Amborella trichopoda]|uniref:Glycoside hydrolase family 19 catalytic domain-containing protein n=1 Tax=Amborella trichopoda TaxID=13333 RepID=W1P8V6_AMBTC|nr:hypothetical protein AMTR_s00079p00183380 [Amborella trichopoda]